MAVHNNYNSNPYGLNAYGTPVPGQTYYPQPVNAVQALLQPVFVHGRAGAEAYQLPPGVTRQTLWDDETDRFYVKAIDEMGRPKIVADNDFQTHIEPEPAPVTESAKVDFSVYPTKKDLEEFLSKFDVSSYLTKADLEKALGELTLGAGGRIVRNESNA